MNVVSPLSRPGSQPSMRAARPSSGRGGELPADRVTLSGSAEPPRNLAKMAFLGGLGIAVGGAAALLIPGAGLGGLLLAALVGGVAGAAIGDNALETAGTQPARPFDPYNPSDLLDPDNMYHPRNPNNPLRY